MKQSFALKVSMILSSCVFVIITISFVISQLLLGRFYLYSKEATLEEAYHSINYVYGDTKYYLDIQMDEFGRFTPTLKAKSDTLTEEMADRFEQMAENENLSILLYRESDRFVYDLEKNTQYKYRPIIYSSIGMESTDSIENNNMYNDFVNASHTIKPIKKTADYVIQEVHVSRLGSNYIYLSAVLKNGDYLLLRSSFESIATAVELTGHFNFYISIAMLVLGVIVMFIVAQRMILPIRQLSVIARKMAKMNFDTKYQVKSDDEIGELGIAINHLSYNLEKTLGELKAANQQLRKDLEIKDKNESMRKEFLSNVSHELKTPIAIIQGYAEGLLDNINDDEESRQFYCEVIVDEANKMNNLVKKLLDLNQLEFGNTKINMEHFDLNEIVNNYLENAEILFKQKEITLIKDIDSENYVWADAYMVEEIFNNYLSNALNHVDGDKIIKITIEKDEEVVRVRVFNTGKTIPETDINKIWDKFYKVDKARTREYGGSGVGLSIVKASMELLGQKYGVINKEDGVEFYFELDAKNK